MPCTPMHAGVIRTDTMSSALSASIFRRGGPKKELFDDGTAGADVQIEDSDLQTLEAELQRQLDILKTPKVGRDWSAALWRPEVGAAELVLIRRNTAQPMGFKWRRRQWLHPEEAAFLVDRSDLLLFVETESNSLQDHTTGPPVKTRRLLSLQETFELMVMTGVPMERYILYSSLSRSGYLVMRYPSRWLVPHDKTPADIWGHGAWRGCTALHPQPLSGARGVQGFRALGQHLRSLHQGGVPTQRCQLEGEEDPGETPQGADGAVGTQDGEAQAAGSAGAPHGQPCSPDPARPSKRSKAAEGDGGQPSGDVEGGGQGGVGAGVSGGSGGQGAGQHGVKVRWWPAMRALPMMASAGKVGGGGDDGGQHAVQLHVRDALAAVCPRLRPLQPIASDAVLPLSEPSQHAHLVFDVYKPGAHVARNKQVFPTVACHIAMCSQRPPTLAELRAADAQALSSTVPVKWASEEGGIISLYEIGEADIIRLM